MQEKTGQRLPGERDLAGQLAISRPRLRELLKNLHGEGLVESRQGSGTYAVGEGQGKLRQVVLLIDSSLKWGEDPFFSLLLDSLQAALQARGIRCFIERTNGMKAATFSGDGIITLGSSGQAVLDAHHETLPLVSLLLAASARPQPKASVFYLDDRQAGYDAARFLWDEGCRAFVFVGRDEITASRERCAGAEAFTNQHDSVLTFISSNLNYSAGLEVGRTISQAASRIGIIAANDWLAAGIWAGLCEQNAAPGLFSLVSFDGLPLSAELGFHSLAVPIEMIARDAVSELERLAGISAQGRSIRYELDAGGKSK